MTPAEALHWIIRRNADAPSVDRARQALPAAEAADATHRALLERVADLEKEVARWQMRGNELFELMRETTTTFPPSTRGTESR